VILGFLLLDVGQVSVVLPWAQEFERPSEQEAKEIFASLHKNLYRAFDYETEDQVYDTLARSVRGDLLEQVYTQILETLIMRDQGGAVSKVVEVEKVNCLVTFPDDPAAPWYTIQCVWRVHGKVGHYGHTHVRVTEYRAQFKVTEEQGTWKIADMEILGQMRIDDGGLTVPRGGDTK
jgi:hypothetical protein